jgi:hypothetical protein
MIGLHPICEPCKLGECERCWGDAEESEWWMECACTDEYHYEDEDADR